MVILLLSGAIFANADDFQGSTHLMPFDEEGIGYNKVEPSDPVTELQDFLNSGKAMLQRDSKHGYLLSLLKELDIPTASQVLVFSKTSFQRDLISPQTPRALFFNDDVYVGYIPGAPMLEVSTADPNIGGVFYTLAQEEKKELKFARTDQCLECHASAKSMGVPGHLLRSFMTYSNGAVELSTGISPITHRTPMEDRWGGWYVTGITGSQAHKGNLFGKEAFERAKQEPLREVNKTNLTEFCSIERYPEPGSDIVALMVLEHQTHMHNFITRLNYEARVQLQRYGHVRYLKHIVDAFLKYLLFMEEAPIEDGVRGTSRFAEEFEARGPFDHQGRSLRQFDLERRLFRYPCSYLIYSKSFDALPPEIKTVIYDRLQDILTGEETVEEFDGISHPTRRAIAQILTETKPELAKAWAERAERTKQ